MVLQQHVKTISALRQTARDCIKDGRHTEGFFHLTHALKLDENNLDLLNERSRCCSDNLQYHFALEDAKQILQLAPNSWLGHYRLGEVYLQTCNYDSALTCYQTAFQCNDSDKATCKERMDKCRKETAMDARNQGQLPWVGCALGIILSSLVVVLDYLSHGTTSTIAHPLAKMGVCLGCAAIGYWGALLYRGYTVGLRKQMLEPPPDLLVDFPGLPPLKKENVPEEPNRPHQD